MGLAGKHCEPLQDAAGRLGLDDIIKQLSLLSGWEVVAENTKLCRRWSFRNFAQALEFVNKVALIAEAENHHPDITFGWGYVDVTLMTHDIGGLHSNDFILAAKINQLG